MTIEKVKHPDMCNHESRLEVMLEKMNNTELLVFYHAILTKLMNRGINPLGEK